jgi:hypothetical protein
MQVPWCHLNTAIPTFKHRSLIRHPLDPAIKLIRICSLACFEHFLFLFFLFLFLNYFETYFMGHLPRFMMRHEMTPQGPSTRFDQCLRLFHHLTE